MNNIDKQKYEMIETDYKSEESLTDMIKSNALVLLIGISNYKNIASLPGVKEDINQYRKLWNNHYKYTIFPTTKDNKWYNKWKWTASEIETCIEEGRELLFDENDNALHDSLIIIICGHGGKSKGGEGVIIPSDYISKNKSKVLTIQQLHNKVSGAWLIDVIDIERLFIIDCCRGKQYNGSIKRGKGTINEQTNLCTLYGNSPGLCVTENIEGGLFSQSLIKYFKDNISQKYTLSILTRLANIYLKKKSNEEQTIWKEGDGNMDFVIFIAYNECHNESMQHVHAESDMELESEEFFIVTNIEKENNKYHYNNKELFITEEKIETEKQQISESVQEAKDDAKDDVNNDNNIFEQYNTDIINKLVALGIGSKKECLAASLLVDDYNNINAIALKILEMQQPQKSETKINPKIIAPNNCNVNLVSNVRVITV